MRIEFTYARRPDHYAGHPGVPGRPAPPAPSYVIAALVLTAGVAPAVAALVVHAGQAVLCGGLGILLGGSIAVMAGRGPG